MTIEITTDRSRFDVDLIHRYLSKDSYWAQNITRERCERSIEHSLCFAAFDVEQTLLSAPAPAFPSTQTGVSAPTQTRVSAPTQTRVSALQVGFARVITDYATFAYVADVFVVPSHRRRGISKAIMEAIRSHPQLQGLRRWMLVTRDAHGLYEQFGFHPLAAPARHMEILTAYSPAADSPASP